MLVVKNSPASAGDIRDTDWIHGSGRFPGGGHGNLLQYSCLDNLMDRAAWRAIVHGVTQSQTRLKWLSTQACMNFSLGFRWKKQSQTSNGSSCDGIWLFWPCWWKLMLQRPGDSQWQPRGGGYFRSPPKLTECWNCFLGCWVLQASSAGWEAGSGCSLSSYRLIDWLLLCGWMSRCFQSSCCRGKIPSAKYYY